MCGDWGWFLEGRRFGDRGGGHGGGGSSGGGSAVVVVCDVVLVVGVVGCIVLDVLRRRIFESILPREAPIRAPAAIPPTPAAASIPVEWPLSFFSFFSFSPWPFSP